MLLYQKLIQMEKLHLSHKLVKKKRYIVKKNSLKLLPKFRRYIKSIISANQIKETISLY